MRKENNKIYVELNDINGLSEFSKYDFIEELGKGANGVVFKAKHRIILTEVVIKIYAVNINDIEKVKCKHLEEIRKNAQYRITNFQGLVFDAGKITVENKEFLYSIMYYVEGITLRKWIEGWKEIKRDNKYIHIKNKSKLIEFNMALGFLFSALKLVDNDDYSGITHGDLNDGNIIVAKQNYSISSDENKSIFFKYCSLYGGYLVPAKIEFIDYGTSIWNNRGQKNGFKRDYKLIFENVDSILSDYNVKSFFDFCEFKKLQVSEDKVKSLINGLIRIILLLNFLESIMLFDKDMFKSEDFKKDILPWINYLVNGRFKWNDNYNYQTFKDIGYFEKIGHSNYIQLKEIIKYYNDKTKWYKIKLGKYNSVEIK